MKQCNIACTYHGCS